MHLQIASAVELLQQRSVDVRPNAEPHSYPDPLALFFLFGKLQPSSPSATPGEEERPSSVPLATRKLTITQGNINNNHIYLTPIMDLFPEDVMGGENKKHAAAKTVRVHWGDERVDTDIVRAKHIFRRRRWVGRFFDATRIAVGDQVLLEQFGLYAYRVSKASQV